VGEMLLAILQRVRAAVDANGVTAAHCSSDSLLKLPNLRVQNVLSVLTDCLNRGVDFAFEKEVLQPEVA